VTQKVGKTCSPLGPLGHLLFHFIVKLELSIIVVTCWRIIVGYWSAATLTEVSSKKSLSTYFAHHPAALSMAYPIANT